MLRHGSDKLAVFPRARTGALDRHPQAEPIGIAVVPLFGPDIDAPDVAAPGAESSPGP
jgi:hypothetical protein